MVSRVFSGFSYITNGREESYAEKGMRKILFCLIMAPKEFVLCCNLKMCFIKNIKKMCLEGVNFWHCVS